MADHPAAHPLVARLAKLTSPAPGGARWSPRGEPADPGELAAFEQEIGACLPEDARAVYLAFGGGVLSLPGATPLGLGPLSELRNLNGDPFYEEGLPGMLIVGGDGGGSVYFYDPRDQLGHGVYALHMAQMGDLALDAAWFIAATFAEAVDLVLAGEDFYRRRPPG